MKAASASYMMDGTRLFVALSLAFASSIAGAQSSLPRGLTTVGPAKGQQPAKTMQAACQQKALQRGQTLSAAKEICASELPECTADSHQEGCVYVLRSQEMETKSLGGAKPTRSLSAK
jgi:hypothetical protein